MCETSNLGIKWSQWHTLMFEGQVRVDMRYVCPKDVKKMLLGHEARERGIGGGKKTKEGWNVTNIAIQPENWCWKEVGFRKDSSMLVGRVKESAKLSQRGRHRKAQALPLTRNERGQT